MRALVTGATGFLGSHLVERLVGDGARVAVLLRPDSDPWRIEQCLPKVELVYGDLTELRQCENHISRFSPQVIFHLAWHGVESIHRNDAGQHEVNLRAAVELAQLAARLGCRALVGIGSQAEYGPQNCRLAESAATMPTTLYGAAKLAAFHLCRVSLASSKVRFAWMRPFSCYGPKDNPSWLIPSLIESLLSGKRVPLTAGGQLWDYLYVADAARAISLVGSCERAEGVFNLGSGKPLPLRHIVESIRDSIDPALPLGFGEVPYRPDQVMHLEADVSRLSAVTQWTPEVALEKGLSQTIAWHAARRSATDRPFSSHHLDGKSCLCQL